MAGPIPRIKDALRETPSAIPCLVAIVLFVIWAGDQAGYPLTHWAPGGLVLLALLAIGLLGSRRRLREVPRPVQIALACLLLYTALSFLSILWAQAQGDAWEGANRTLLYLVVFALFALAPRRGLGAVLVLGLWTLAMIGLAAFALLHVDDARNLGALFGEGRLRYPGGYENATAATWAMVAWPALLLSAGERVHWAARGVFAGGAVLLSGVALFSLSRGSLYSTPLMLVLVFALVPGRLRTFVALIPVAAGVGLTAPAVLRVGDRLKHAGDAKAAMHTATLELLLAAVAVALIVAVAALLERRTELSPEAARRVRLGVGAVAVATLVAIVAGGLVAAGDPVKRVSHAWDTFKGGYAADRASGSRLTSGLGSDRYDFYRVALDEFTAHPLVGIGADNYQQQYLLHGHGHETPHYPHSVELRTLAQTGLLGALLAVIGLGAALLAAARALGRDARQSDPLAATVVGAALAGFAYWLVHGSFDWFWEFAGLGAPAFALLGLACALGSRAATPSSTDASPAGREPGVGGSVGGGEQDVRAARAKALRPLGFVLASLLTLAAIVSLLLPWLSQLRVQSAVRVWPTAPRLAYEDLNKAADLNPLSDEPYSLAGSIALRFGDLPRAQREFSLALERDSRDVYATLELGAIASARGHRHEAVALLERAVLLSPRDELIQETLFYVRNGHSVSIEQLNSSILLKARRLA
jgi:tetratricopeptide (TPR) repeat protein